MRSADQIAKVWYEKANSETDGFDRFVYLWFAFNALYGQFMDNRETDAIIDFLRASNISQMKYEKILNHTSAQYFGNRIIRDCKNIGNDTSSKAEKYKNNANTLRYRLNALVLILYQVRCNLFHGNKSFINDLDNEIVNHAANVMQLLLKEVLQL